MKSFAALVFALLPLAAQAENPSIVWPSRQSKVICGGTADGEDLALRVVTENEIIAAQSKNERVLIYLDFHKPGQVRVVIGDGMTDQEYDQREAALAKLTPAEAELLRSLSATRISDFYVGFTDGIFHLVTTAGSRSVSLSCQEIAVP